MQTPLLCKSEPRVGVFRPDRRLETKEERDARYMGKRGGVRMQPYKMQQRGLGGGGDPGWCRNACCDYKPEIKPDKW